MDKQKMIKKLNDYGMPEMYHKDLLKGKKVNTLNGSYKIINDDITKL